MKWILIGFIGIAGVCMSFAVAFHAAATLVVTAKPWLSTDPPSAQAPVSTPTNQGADTILYPTEYVITVTADQRLPACDKQTRRNYLWLLAKDGVADQDDLLFCKKNHQGKYQWHYQPQIPVTERIR